MKLLKKSMKLVHNMSVQDVAIFKLAIAAATIWIVKLFPVIASLNIWVYIAIWIIGAGYLLRKM